jgi:hypothetical protein
MTSFPVISSPKQTILFLRHSSTMLSFRDIEITMKLLFWVLERNSVFLRNVGIYRPVCTAPVPRRTSSSSSPPWKPQITYRNHLHRDSNPGQFFGVVAVVLVISSWK